MRDSGGQERRAFLAIVLAMGVLLVWNVVFPPPRRSAPPPDTARVTEETATPAAPTAEFPAPDATGLESPLSGSPGAVTALAPVAGSVTAEPTTVRVESERMHLTFDGMGARVTEITLPKYRETADRPVQLLPQPSPGALTTIVTTSTERLRVDALPWRLASDTDTGDSRRLVFELETQGLALRKTFDVPNRGSVIHVEQEVVRDDIGIAAWGLSWGSGLRFTEGAKGGPEKGYFQGTVLAEGSVQRKAADAVRKAPVDFPGNTFYVGVQNKYFLAAIVPKGEHQGPARLWSVSSGDPKNPSVAGEIVTPRTSSLAADRVRYDVYIGPQDYSQLAALGLGLEGSLDLGASWIRPLSRIILSTLIAIHSVIPNYGVTIILFSLVMNLLFFPLTYKSTKAMRHMSALKPKLDALKEKYKNEPQKMSEATMRIYKEAGVNPLAGCLPLLLQMPIFFALYAVLIRTIELRQAPFMLWVTDLSRPDVVFELPFAIPFLGAGVCLLPIVMGITSYFQSKQTMVDPTQKMMVIMMPIMMTFIFFSMPSGLVLYWLTSNLFTIGSKFFFKADAPIVFSDDAEPAAGARRAVRAGAKS